MSIYLVNSFLYRNNTCASSKEKGEKETLEKEKVKKKKKKEGNCWQVPQDRRITSSYVCSVYLPTPVERQKACSELHRVCLLDRSSGLIQ